MHFGKYHLLLLTFIMGILGNAHASIPVPYAGKVSIDGVNFDGQLKFMFAIYTASNDMVWDSGGSAIEVPVSNGRYLVLLGGQGMRPLPASLFHENDELYVGVYADLPNDNVGQVKLGELQRITAKPYALVAEMAKIADFANSAETAKVADSAKAVQAGAITKQMLGQDVLSDLNRTVNHNDLSPQIKADINATIGMNRLSTEVTEKLNQEKTTTNYNAPSVGSLLAVPYGSSVPLGYSLYQRGKPKELVWEEKAPVSLGRYAYDGIELVNDKIYFVGGNNGADLSIAERYDPAIDQWVTINPLSVAKHGVATASLDGKLFVIGGFNYENRANFKEVEVFNPSSSQWSSSSELPIATRLAAAITFRDKIYLIGGRHDDNSRMNQVAEYSDSLSIWETKATMPTARNSLKLVVYKDKIWAIGGFANSATEVVESYDPVNNVWSTEASLTTPRLSCSAWVANGCIFVAGGSSDGSNRLNTIEYYDPIGEEWKLFGNLPENKTNAGAVTFKNKVFLISGSTASNTYSKKVFAADLNASVEGVYDLYRKDGDAPVGTPVVQSEYADGSVTTSKLDATILKYLKPEITSQPQAQTVYADTNATFSVTAEGKYLTYQWKKDGVDLAGETNATLNITDANATNHDGNYSVVVSNDFGSVESGEVLVDINTTWSTDGLVGWWKFDEGSGTVAYDSSGNGNNGNLTNGPTWTTGKIGGSLSFDGVDDYIKVPNSSELNPNSLTLSTWYNGTKSFSGVGTNVIIHKPYNSHSNPFYQWMFSIGGDLYDSNNNFTFGIIAQQTSSSFYLEPQQTISNWNHFVGSVNATSKKISSYLNGILLHQTDWIFSNIPSYETDIFIAKHGNLSGSTAHTPGLIDDVRIYDRALSAEEVQALYNLGQ